MYPKKLPSRSQASDSLGAGPRHLDFEVSSRAAGLVLQNRWSASDSRWRQPGQHRPLGRAESSREDSEKLGLTA